MQRPTRIAVFGVLCLIIGGVVGIHNFSQLGVAIGGPEAVQIPSAEDAPGQMGKVVRDNLKATQSALKVPIFRFGLGIKSLLSSVMAGLLIAVGFGLMRDRLWAIKFARIWSAYAIVAAAVSVVLHTEYVVSQTPSAAEVFEGMVLGKYIGMVFMMLMLCIFPALLWYVLPKPHVIEYLRERSALSESPSVLQAPVSEAGPVDAQQPQAPSPDQSPSESTWRDDPWNDPGSR